MPELSLSAAEVPCGLGNRYSRGRHLRQQATSYGRTGEQSSTRQISSIVAMAYYTSATFGARWSYTNSAVHGTHVGVWPRKDPPFHRTAPAHRGQSPQSAPRELMIRLTCSIVRAN
jgi:hypothetical protein